MTPEETFRATNRELARCRREEQSALVVLSTEIERMEECLHGDADQLREAARVVGDACWTWRRSVESRDRAERADEEALFAIVPPICESVDG